MADQLQPQTTDKLVLNRLLRAQGQLAAAIRAVESGADCRDVVHQLATVSGAVNRAGFLAISHAMRDCLENPDADQSSSVAELERLFLSLA